MMKLTRLLVSPLIRENREEYKVNKEVIPTLPPWFHPTLLGYSSNSIRQYRTNEGGHVREYRDAFVYHKDRFNPETHPIEHIVHDTEILYSLFTLGMISVVFRKFHQNNRKKR